MTEHAWVSIDFKVTFDETPVNPDASEYQIELYLRTLDKYVIGPEMVVALQNWDPFPASVSFPIAYVNTHLECNAVLVNKASHKLKRFRGLSGQFVPAQVATYVDIHIRRKKLHLLRTEYTTSAGITVSDTNGCVPGATITMIGAGHAYTKLSRCSPPTIFKVEEGFYSVTVVNGNASQCHYLDCTDDINDTFVF